MSRASLLLVLALACAAAAAPAAGAAAATAPPAHRRSLLFARRQLVGIQQGREQPAVVQNPLPETTGVFDGKVVEVPQGPLALGDKGLVSCEFVDSSKLTLAHAAQGGNWGEGRTAADAPREWAGSRRAEAGATSRAHVFASCGALPPQVDQALTALAHATSPTQLPAARADAIGIPGNWFNLLFDLVRAGCAAQHAACSRCLQLPLFRALFLVHA